MQKQIDLLWVSLTDLLILLISIYEAYLAKGIGFLHVCVCMCVCKCDCVGGCYVLFRNYNYVIYFKDKSLYQSTKTY